MRKFWRRRREPTEGEQARQQAEVELERTRAETPLYVALGAEVREIRERNHLTELFLSLHNNPRSH
ncbi:hypothetical protein ASE01_20135 [Nocardioides sp. Root190]|uniref:DUF7620 family protein n=1 Tax=Nocardioides sp. Root190 TaxID=1736488 RepID=UPI0006FEE2DB|nr:hypothetical protein [Nocardioides sp. Root190]KRB73087.1 hypothetical protein ASE01_20135 [Nocardioides sp. Root190]